MKIYQCDADLVLRLLRNDRKKEALRAKSIFLEAEAKSVSLYVSNAVMAEIVEELCNSYQLPAPVISDALLALLDRPGVKLEEKEATILALVDFGQGKADFLSALQASIATING